MHTCMSYTCIDIREYAHVQIVAIYSAIASIHYRPIGYNR